MLVNLTNDGWFWGSSELDMHLACGVFRAVECRKPLSDRRQHGLLGLDRRRRPHPSARPPAGQGVIVAEPRLDRRHSWYLAHGDWFAGVCLACAGCAVWWGFCGRIRKNAAPTVRAGPRRDTPPRMAAAGITP